MTVREIGTREQWLSARLNLLAAEKALTRRSDELARQREALPWVRIHQEYIFDTEEGEQTLRDLFAGRSQLLVYHFMFAPAWTAGCRVCTLHAESFDRAIVHLNQRDVSMVCASRGQLAQLLAYKQRMDLTFRWVSSEPSDFNYDFGVSLRAGADPDQVVFNFDSPWSRYNSEEHAGLSAFALEGGVVYHTYSCHARGLEAFNVTYQLLDRVPRGRDEGRLQYPAAWIRRRDEYDAGRT